MPESVVYNVDCLEFMKTLPDDYFDLCCTNPPYGAGFTDGGGSDGAFKTLSDNYEKCIAEMEDAK